MRLGLLLLTMFCALAGRALAAPPLEAYGRLPAVGQVSLSPSGELISMALRDGGSTTVQVVRPDGQSVYSTKLSAKKVRQIEWAGDDHLVVLVSETVSSHMLRRDYEMVGAYFVNVRTGKAGIVFDRSRRMVQGVFGYYGAAAIDGRWHIFVGGFQAERFANGSSRWPDLYRIDLETGQEGLVTMGAAGASDWIVGADGRVAAMSTFDADGAHFTLYSGARDRTLFNASARRSQIALQGAGRTAGSAVVAFMEQDAAKVVQFAPDGPADGEVLLADELGASLLRHPDSGLLIGLVIDGHPRFDNPNHQKRADAIKQAFPGLRATLVSYSRNFDRVVVRTEGPKDSGAYWIVDFARKSADPIAYVHPEIEPANVGPMRTYVYKAADGLSIEGVLTLPPGGRDRGLPLIVLPHGGPITGPDRAGFDWWAQAFASRGYVVLQPNYRGTLGYGDAFRRAANGEVGRKMQTDLSDGVAALARDGVIDPARVCVVGASYGGYAALAGVTLQQGLYRCAVSVNGVSHFGKMLVRESTGGQDQGGARFLRDLLGVAKGQDLAQIAPQESAARADAPVLLIHGEDDTVVPSDQSRDMERALKRAGKPVELVTLAGEDHWLTGEATRQQMLAKAVAFVEKHNPPN